MLVPRKSLSALAFSPDGKYIVTGEVSLGWAGGKGRGPFLPLPAVLGIPELAPDFRKALWQIGEVAFGNKL